MNDKKHWIYWHKYWRPLFKLYFPFKHNDFPKNVFLPFLCFRENFLYYSWFSKNDFVSMESVPNNTKNLIKKWHFFSCFRGIFFLLCNFSALLKLILAVCLQDQTKAHNFWTLPYIELQLFIPQVLIKVVHFY